MKGERKTLGHSEPRDVKMHLDLPYWKAVKGV